MSFRGQLERVWQAQMFARGAHSAVGQVRKYTGVPYYTHTDAVSNMLIHVPHVTDEMLMAAFLHDVVEDTAVKLTTILEMFGAEVARLVDGMTKASYKEGTPRRTKVLAEVQRLKMCCPRVKTIKLADSIHNMEDFIQHDPDYARKIYLPEKRILLDVALKEGDTTLWKRADKIIKDFLK